MKEPKRTANLLLVTSVLYQGGVQKIVSILANALSGKYRVTVAYCCESGIHQPFNEHCSLRKLPEYAENDPPLKKAAIVRKQIRALRTLKAGLKTDLSLSMGNMANFLNAMSKGKELVICSERNNPKKSWGLLFPLTRTAFRRADFIIFQSDTVQRMFGPDIRKKSRILKNPLPIPAPAADHREKKIISMGRLVPQKNQAALIRSFSLFHQRHPDYKLHIFGEGPLEERLRQMISSLQLTDHIILEGNRTDVHEQIRDAEIFVLSSDYEGLSNALLECMAMGIGCISTRCEGSVDVIRNGENGLLVNVRDVKGLARAMCTLAENPALRRRLEGQAMKDMKAYDENVVLRDWEDVILKVLETPRPDIRTN